MSHKIYLMLHSAPHLSLKFSRRCFFMDVGNEVRNARIANGLTVYALAKRLGVSTSHLYAIECGEKNPSLEMLEKMLRILGRKLEVCVDAK